MQYITSWSYSRAVVFESCRLRARLAYVDKIPEPLRALPPGKSEHANDRGTRVHTAAEKYVTGTVELLPELASFSAEFTRANQLYKEGLVSVEGEWAFTQDWAPTAWMSNDAWLRMKLDVFVRLTDTHAVVIDYKTGKKSGNEIKHAEQGQLYQLAAFMRYPELEEIDVEFWYTDQDDLTHMRYTRDQGLRFFRGFDQRGKRITSEREFPPSPNAHNCRWCPYGPKGTGHCTVGIQR